MDLLLAATTGPLRGKTWPVGGTPLLIGRGAACDVVINDALVSRKHCQLVCQDGVAYLLDLGSRNHPLVNGKPYTNGVIRPGDTIALGQCTFVLAEVAVSDGTQAPGKTKIPPTPYGENIGSIL
jgi:pSer/pThr/pTyr-binding forkhead associated (FHA) protein